MKSINDTPIHRHLSTMERECRAAGKTVPPTKLLIVAMGDYLSEHHPNVFTPVYKCSDESLSIGLDDDGHMLVRYPPHPKLPHTDIRMDLKFCYCGETPILITSISDEEGLKLIMGVLSHDCEHGYTVPHQAHKPASKKRRKRDARRQAA